MSKILLLRENQVIFVDKMKGISPIVASVILIAITMAIAGILSFWAGNFVQKNIQETENSTGSISCIGAQFKAYSACKYYPQTREIKMILENQREKDLTLTGVYVFYPNNLLKQEKISLVLPGNQLMPFNFSNVDPGFDSFQIRSSCSNVNLDFNCTQ